MNKRFFLIGLIITTFMMFSFTSKNEGLIESLPTKIEVKISPSSTNGLFYFTPVSNGGVSYDINFGDSGLTKVYRISAGNSIAHLYQEGAYTLKIKAYDSEGNIDSIAKTFRVSYQTPTALSINSITYPNNLLKRSFVPKANNALYYTVYFGNEKNDSSIIFPDDTVYVPSLIWSDEFNYTGELDSTKWNYEIGNGPNGWGNNEAQYYTNRSVNATVSEGTLKITARKENYNGFNYTSTRINTQNKFSQKYGRIEARIKLPTGVGVWPAFWMLGDNFSTIGWPSCGEIDIMEMVGRFQNTIYAALHYPGHSGGAGTINTTTNPTASTAFHIYSVKWTASSINFYVDNIQFAQADNNSSIPFNHPFFIILNVAMGGSFGGPIASNFSQSTMEVDYVRVYAE